MEFDTYQRVSLTNVTKQAYTDEQSDYYISNLAQIERTSITTLMWNMSKWNKLEVSYKIFFFVMAM